MLLLSYPFVEEKDELKSLETLVKLQGFHIGFSRRFKKFMIDNAKVLGLQK